MSNSSNMLDRAREKLKLWKSKVVAEAEANALESVKRAETVIRSYKPPDVSVTNLVGTPEVHNHMPEAQVKVYNDVHPADVKAPDIVVKVDMAPVAEAIQELGELFTSALSAMERQSKQIEALIQQAGKKGKRRLVIRHDDGTESTIEDGGE